MGLERPEFVWLGLPIAVLTLGVLAFISWRQKAFFYRRFANLGLWQHCSVFLALSLAIGSLLVILAGPSTMRLSKQFVSEVPPAICFVIDSSFSMQGKNPQDVLMLDRAKSIALEIIRSLKTGDVCVYRFSRKSLKVAAFASLQKPADRDFLIRTIEQIEPEGLTESDTLLSGMIESTTADLAERNSQQTRIIILLSDGGFNTPLWFNQEEIALKLQAEKIRVIAIGVGSRRGEPTPNNEMVTYLEPETLQQLAIQTDGFYLEEEEFPRLKEKLITDFLRGGKGMVEAETKIMSKLDISPIFFVLAIAPIIYLLRRYR